MPQPNRSGQNVLVIRVEFPALDALVAWLKERDNQQDTVDDLAAQVAGTTEGLKTSSAGLQGAVDATQP